jgi:gluconolactonase
MKMKPTNGEVCGLSRAFVCLSVAALGLVLCCPATAASSPTMKMPDTGQTIDATTTFGEDSDYTINPPSYTDNGNNTITDNVTGLMWQKVDAGESTWDNAVTRAVGFTTGGYSDWRLPTPGELYGILNLNNGNPAALNLTYFPSNPAGAAEYWWTSEIYGTDAAKVWCVNSGGGLGPKPKSETLSAGGTLRYHARYVRGAKQISGRNFVNNGDGTITDSDTGLMWTQVPGAAVNWAGALNYAENLTLAGHTDWRLPNIKELETLTDYTLATAATPAGAVAPINRAMFPTATTPATAYWSSTAVRSGPGAPTSAWLVEYGVVVSLPAANGPGRNAQGLISYEVMTSRYPVFAVRGPEAAAPDPGTTGTARLVNIATRVAVGGVAGTPIPGFVLSGTGTKSMLVRAVGPTLAVFGVGAVLADPRLSLISGTTTVSTNDNWLATDAATMTAAGAFALSVGSKDAALVASLPPGAYTAPVVAVDGGSGVALLEVYDASSSTAAAVVNASTRAYVGTGDSVLIPGFVIGGTGTLRLLIRAVGQTLASFGVTGVLADPTITLYRGTTVLATNDNWSTATNASEMSSAATAVGAFAIASGSRDAAILTSLPAGSYTAVVSGVGNTTGTALVELYTVSSAIPDPPVSVGVIASGATLTRLASGLHFTEGPAADAAGNVYFSDITGDTIYQWTVANQLSVFRANSGGANGLAFDRSGNLLACEGDNGRLVSISPLGNVTVLAGTYAGQRYNEPNDLWIDSTGGVYFTDPVFLGHSAVQGGEHVYYLAPDRSTVTRVVSDLVRPNGLVGTPDGRTLYIADWGASKVFRYNVNANGTLANKTAFASVRCDGMTMDAEGNLYFTENAVLVYDSRGNMIEQISIAERPTNVEFGGSDRKTLFITTDAGSLYSIRMRVQGVATVAN